MKVQDKMVPATLVSERAGEVSRADLVRLVNDTWQRVKEEGTPAVFSDAAGSDQAPEGTFLYVERLDEVRLERVTGSLRGDLIEDSMAGRVFGSLGEVSWLLHQHLGRYSVWFRREGAQGRSCKALLRRYYLRGEVHKDGVQRAGDKVLFQDGSTRARLAYPVGLEARPYDRAFVWVLEYYSEKPAQWPEDREELQRVFNTPRLLGHRCTGLGVGQE